MSQGRGFPLHDVLLVTALAVVASFIVSFLVAFKALGLPGAIVASLGVGGCAAAGVLGGAFAYSRLLGRRPVEGKARGAPGAAGVSGAGDERAGAAPTAGEGPSAVSEAPEAPVPPTETGAPAPTSIGAETAAASAPAAVVATAPVAAATTETYPGVGGGGDATPASGALYGPAGEPAARPERKGSKATVAPRPGSWIRLPFKLGGKGSKAKFPDVGVFSYRIFGRVAERAAPRMDLDHNLRSALIRSTPEKYVAKMIFVGILIFAASAAVTTPILWRWVVPLQAVGLGLALGAIAGAVGFALMYIYPSLAARGRRSKIDSSLNFTAQYMAILAGAEVTLERIMKSIIRSDVDRVIKDEFTEIVKRIDLFGEDLHTALEGRIAETPSRRFADLLRGMLAVGSMGGNLRRYLSLQGKVLMRERRIELRKQLDGLGLLAEIYISMGIVLPIIIVIMLSVMSFIGSSGIDAMLWMYITTFVLIPATSALMLLIIDTSVPREE